MRNVDELKKEALNDLIYEAEQNAKSQIKSTIQSIISEQKKMAECARKIGEYQANLKAIQVEVINVEV